jgi:hypothetical protein
MIRFGIDDNGKKKKKARNEDENEDVWGEERRKGFEN